MRKISFAMLVLIFTYGCNQGGNAEKRFYDTDALKALNSLFDAQVEDLNTVIKTVQGLEETVYEIRSGEPLAIWESNQKKTALTNAHNAELAALEVPVTEAEGVFNAALEEENNHANQVYMHQPSRLKACGDDSCGGSCGTCNDGYFCHEGGCRKIQVCAQKACGSDDANGSCGSCEEGQYCTKDGSCLAQPVAEIKDPECEPECLGIKKYRSGGNAYVRQERDYSASVNEWGVSRIPTRDALATYIQSIDTKIVAVKAGLEELAQLSSLIAKETAEITRIEANVVLAKTAIKATKAEWKLKKAAAKATMKAAKNDPTLAEQAASQKEELDNISVKIRGELKSRLNDEMSALKERKAALKALSAKASKAPKLLKSLTADLENLTKMKGGASEHLSAWKAAAANTAAKQELLDAAKTKRDGLRDKAIAAHEAAIGAWETAHAVLTAPAIPTVSRLTYARYNRVEHDVNRAVYGNGAALSKAVEETLSAREAALNTMQALLSGQEAAEPSAEESDEDTGAEEGAQPDESTLQNMISGLEAEVRSLDDLQSFLPVLAAAEQRAYGLRLATIDQREVHIP